MLYVLQLHQDNSTNSAHVSSVSEFTLAQPCLSFAILDAGTKRFKKTKGDDSHLDEITTGKTFTEISLLSLHKNCVTWDCNQIRHKSMVHHRIYPLFLSLTPYLS